MEVILLKDFEGLGVVNDIVKVKGGYGRNYLIPKGIALLANDSNRKVHEERRKHQEVKEKKLMEEYQLVADKLNKAKIKIGAKVGTTGKIFGSVTTHQLIDAIKKQEGIEVDRKKITIPEEVKNLGTFQATIDLHKDIVIELNFEVVPE